MANFLLLNTDFFLVASGPAQKAVPVPFLRGGFGAGKTENWVSFGVKWTTIGNYITRSKKKPNSGG